MAKNKSDNNSGDMRTSDMTNGMTDMNQNQNKSANNKKGSTNKNKNSGAQAKQ